MGYLLYSQFFSGSSCQVSGRHIRQESSEQPPQPLIEEALGACRNVQVKSIAVKLGNPAGSNDNTLGIPVLNNVQSQDHRVNKRRRQPVILWRGKGEQVDILLLLTLLGCRVRADDRSAG